MEREVFLRSMGGPVNAIREILSEMDENEALNILKQVTKETLSSLVLAKKDEIQSVEESVQMMYEIVQAIAPYLSACLVSLKTPAQALEAWLSYSSGLIASFCSAIVSMASGGIEEKRALIRALPEMYREMLEYVFNRLGDDVFKYASSLGVVS